MIPPVADQPVQRTVNRSVGWDVRMDEALTHEIRACLLCPVCAEDLKGRSVDSQRLDHERTVIWDPGRGFASPISML